MWAEAVEASNNATDYSHVCAREWESNDKEPWRPLKGFEWGGTMVIKLVSKTALTTADGGEVKRETGPLGAH